LATVRVRRAEASVGAGNALKAIRLLVGRSQTSSIAVAKAAIDELPKRPPPIDALVAEAGRRRPELLALASLVKAQESYLALRTSQLWPDLFLGGSVDYVVTSNATRQIHPFLYDPY